MNRTKVVFTCSASVFSKLKKVKKKFEGLFERKIIFYIYKKYKMDQYDMVSHDLYYFLYKSDRTSHNTEIKKLK